MKKMFLNIILWSTVIVVISANNAIPVQTYSIYQQNGFMSPTGSQAINIQPYVQQVIDQNQPQPLNVLPSALKQAILNKLLTASSLQPTVELKPKAFSSILSGTQNNQVPANLVYNKVVVPAEYLVRDQSNSNIATASNDVIKSPQQSNKKKRKSRKRQSDVQKIEDNYQKNITVSDHSAKQINNTSENSKTSKRNSRKQNTQTINAEADESETETKTPRRRKNKARNRTTENPVLEESVAKNGTKPHRRRKKPKVDNNDAKNTEPENPSSKETMTKEIKENVDFDITNDGMDNENRKTRNSKHDINDIQRSIPNTPKEITNKFLSNVNQFNNPMMSNWFANYENLYQSLLVNQPATVESRPKRKKKPKRNRKNKRRNNSQHRNSTDVSSVGTDVTPSKSIYINERPLNNVYTYPIVETFDYFGNDDRNNKYSSNEIFKDGYSMSDFEDRYDGGHYEGYIDDYYPTFADSAAYTANNKEIILKNLNDNKYYYATDRIETDIPQKYQNYDFTGRVQVDNEQNRNIYDDYQTESIKSTANNFNDEIHFRSPPFLETPDFITRQIDKSEIRPEIHYIFDDSYVNDKSSSYSNAKTPYYNTDKYNRVKMKPKDVETVYAKSKVAAYGPIYVPEHTVSTGSNSNPWIEDDFESDSFQLGGTTYVVAKSLDY